MPYISSIERMGIEKGMKIGEEIGIEIGRQRGVSIMFLRILKSKFNVVPTKYVNLIKKTDAETLLILLARVLEAKKLTDIFKK